LALALQEQNIGVDVLINCVGELAKFTRAENHKFKEINSAMATNFYANIFAVNHMLPILKKSNSPSIVNVSCVSAMLPVKGTSIYSASKSALKSYTEILQQELEEFYVAIILLGKVKTNFLKNQDELDQKKIYKRAMSPNSASDKIIKALNKKKKRIVVGYDAKLGDYLSRFAPNFASRLTNRFLKKRKIRI